MNKIAGVTATLLVATVSLGARAYEPAQDGAASSHVIVVSIDGLRPDAIDKYQPRTLLRLRAEGAWAHAQTILPSKTLPSHVSMLTGVQPTVHGVTWNSDKTKQYGYVHATTVFEVAKAHGFTTAAFFSKTKFHHLQKPGTLDYTQAPRAEFWMSTRTMTDVQQYLRYNQPNLLFVHIAEPDYAGHAVGWMSAPYGWGVRRADAAIEALLRAADRSFGAGNYTLIITADHGGHGRDHGSDDERDVTIPWIVWGRGVQQGEVAGIVKTTDTAATALWLLGVPAPEGWSGSAVATAFTQSAQQAVQTAFEQSESR